MSNMNLPWHSLRLFPLVLLVVSWERGQPHLAATPFQVAVFSDKDFPAPSFLQAFLPPLQAEESFVQMDIYAIPQILSHLQI